MRILNKVTDEGYIQWVVKFVKDVLKHSELKCNEVVVEDIEYNKRILLTVDGEDYGIRTWSFIPVIFDKYENPCGESVSYTLFKYYDDNHGSHGMEIDNGNVTIKWNNY